jgi:catechol 2,3-dioxygenase-like lactoylglutathione lyase family enzyme
MGGTVTNINHCSITVKNMEESLRFYKKYFGLEPVSEFDLTVDAEGSLKGITFKAVYLKAGDDFFELIEYQNKSADKGNDLNSWDIGSSHIAFSFDGVVEFHKRYKDEVAFLSSPIHSVTDGLDATWIYLRDPNGTIIELSEDHLA